MNVRLEQARLRQYPKVTQARAAALVGRSTTQYGDYERGKVEPPKDILIKLANLWNAPELLTDVTITGLPQEGLAIDWGRVPCGGEWMPPTEPTYVSVPIEYAQDNNRVVTIVGDSMSPTVIDGDRVIVRLAKSPPPGSIVLVRSSEGEMTIKRYKFVDGKPILSSDNPNYPSADTRDCEFVGQVIRMFDRDLTIIR